MLTRLIRVISSIFGASSAAAFPVKALSGIVISIIIPYLLYAFLGGFGIALALVGIIWAVIYLSKKRN